MSIVSPTQLSFDLGHKASLAGEDLFIGDSNRSAVELIHSWPAWPSPHILLMGAAGCGKSHLARIWAAKSEARVVETLNANILSQILADNPKSVILEDIDRITSEEALIFELVNDCLVHKRYVLLTSRISPDEMKFSKADLHSRLRLATPEFIHQPDDDLMRGVLMKLFADRQLQTSVQVIDYLLTRIERSFSAMQEVVDEIDRYSLARGRAVTRQLVAEILHTLDKD